MSRVKLGKIEVSVPTNREPNYYVGSIVNSESGFLKPRIIYNSHLVDLIYGRFKYYQMYKKLIDQDIPVLLSPILTEESQFNRASIRLNTPGSYIDYCYPRYDKIYYQEPKNSILVRSFTDTEKVSIPIRSKHYIPHMVLVQDATGWDMIETSSYYSKDAAGNVSIEIQFNELTSGLLICELMETLDSSYYRSFEFSQSIEFDISSNNLPDIVVLDEKSEQVSCLTSIINDGGTYKCQIISNTDEVLTAYIRDVPSELYDTKNFISDLVLINHLNGLTPILKSQRTEELSTDNVTISVLYSSFDSLVARINQVDTGVKVVYNISESVAETISPTSIDIEELTYSIILDFTKMIDDDTWKTEENSYFMLYINGLRVLFLRKVTDIIPNNLYDSVIYLLDSNNNPINDLGELYDKIKSELINLIGQDHVLSFSDECQKSLLSAIQEVGEEEFDADINQWHDQVLYNLYKNELYLGNYLTLINFFEDNYVNYDTYDEMLTMVDLIPTLDEFHQYKLLINYDSLSYDMNYYKMNGLKISNCFNSTQDHLCDLTNSNKVIEFYSKVRGSVGERIKITIEEDPEFDFYYNITISLDDFVESYYCYTIRNSDAPEDAIDIRAVSRLSELVEIKIYDYLLNNNQLVDQVEVEEYGEEFNPNRVISIQIPIGSYQLRRITNEYITYKDYQSTLDYLKELKYYPDLFLAPEKFTALNDQVKDIYSYIKSSEESSILLESSSNSGIYSQAFVCIDWDDLYNANKDKFLSYNNRIIYFYKDFTIDNYEIPMFYPYIYQLIYGEVLGIPQDTILCNLDSRIKGGTFTYKPIGSRGLGQPREIDYIDTEGKIVTTLGEVVEDSEIYSITELLDISRVNYLKYDNLRYYYLGISEAPNQRSNIIAQFCCSKVSRAFFEWNTKLHTLQPNKVDNYISDIITRLHSCLPYVEFIDYVIDKDYHNRQFSINVVLQMKSLKNTQYKLNFILNLI